MIISECFEYCALPLSFLIITFSGVWCPNDWKSSFKIFYRFYTAVQIISAILFWLSIFINIIIMYKKNTFNYESTFGLNTLSYAMYKEVFVLCQRKKIIKLLKLCFEDKWYKPIDIHEIDIIEKYAHETRWVTQVYGIGILSGLFVKAFMPIVTSNSSWNLPMEAWYPYDVDNPRNYFLSYIQQVIGGVPLMCLHIGIDSLFVGLVLRICTQLELLKNRLQCISKYSTLNTISKAVVKIDLQQWDNLLTDCVCKHANILRSGKRINEEFYGILTGQIIATIPNVCINIYLLSQQKSGITFRSIDLFICFATCLMQIFLYCWYGNKIILHSLDISNAAYDVNWPSLDTVSKKKLLIVMVRSTQSIKVSTGSFIMNNKSFIEILKTSYSAFRVLQRTS